MSETASMLSRHKFDERPFIAIWETTQACDLVCKHCRACAQSARDPGELTTSEGKRLLDELAEAHIPLVVLTGGDPAKRPDLLELVAHGVGRGINLALTPSATPLVTDELVRKLAAAGLSRLAISIDGSTAAVHDAFRGVDGSFAEAQRILATARAAKLQTQINTSIHMGNTGEIASMARLVESVGARLWSVFYVVPTGRAQVEMLPRAEEVERTMNELAELAEVVPFAVKTTAAPHYRRVLAQRAKLHGASAEHGVHGRAAVRINDGRGFADAIVLALPAHAAARLVPDRGLADELAGIRYTSTATVFFAVPQASLRPGLVGSGFIVPPGEGGVLAGTWVSSKWPGRAPAASALIRAFLGGVRCDIDVNRESDQSLAAIAHFELSRLMGPLGRPHLTRVYRHVAANPQPTVGHVARVARIARARARLPGMHLVGAGYDGVSIADCVRQARVVADAVVAEL